MADEILNGVTGADGPHYDEDLSILNSEETSGEVEEKDEEESEESEETVVEDKDEEEEKEDTEEETEELPKVPFARPTIKEIKTKYPEFFKDFPEIKDALFRETRFTQYFPTVEDAEEAFKDNEAFTTLSDAALSGDPSPILESLEKTDKKALETFALSFLPTLYKRNQEIYSTVLTPVFESLLRQVYKDGDENLKNSCVNIAGWLFGKDGEEVASGKKTLSKSVQITEDQKKLKEEKELRESTEFRKAAGEVSESVNQGLFSLVMKDFDPDHVFTPTIRKMLVQDIVKRIDNQLGSDAGHKAVMGSRWKRARANGFSSDEKSKLVSTYLARAKSLIPTVREKVRTAALGKEKKSSERIRERVTTTRREVNGGRPARSSNGKDIDYSKMSDLEILDS